MPIQTYISRQVMVERHSMEIHKYGLLETLGGHSHYFLGNKEEVENDSHYLYKIVFPVCPYNKAVPHETPVNIFCITFESGKTILL